jgi:hypothetical protein
MAAVAVRVELRGSSVIAENPCNERLVSLSMLFAVGKGYRGKQQLSSCLTMIDQILAHDVIVASAYHIKKAISFEHKIPKPPFVTS